MYGQMISHWRSIAGVLEKDFIHRNALSPAAMN